MRLRSVLRQQANRGLQRLGLEVSRRSAALGAAHPFTMERAVRRAKRHGLEINTFIDLGASNGQWSRMAATIFDDAHFLAVEALSEWAGDLEVLKRSQPRFDYEIAVIGSEPGRGYINVSDDLRSSGVYDGSAASARSVPMISVDDLVAGRRAEPAFGIKFDTHGHELPILAGAAETLRKTNLIIMEVYNFADGSRTLRFPQMCEHLEGLGFRCFDMCSPMLRPGDGALWQMDLFFAPASSRIFAEVEYSASPPLTR